jgi:hypothetical protein
MANEYKLGSSVIVRLNDGRLVEAKIRAVIEQTNGVQANLGRRPPEVFVIQLREARKEWRRGT